MSEELRQPRQIMIDSLSERCRECTPAMLVIGNTCALIEAGEDIDPKAVGEKLSHCVEGPEDIGHCGTEKTVCRHDSVNPKDDFVSQVQTLTKYSL